MKHIAFIVLLFSGSVSLSACSGVPFSYKVPVQQGNIITEDMVEQLRPGMSMRQVRFVLGTPAIEDSFRSNRWDYVHTERAGGGGKPTRLTVIFDDNDQLAELDGDLAPDNWGR